MRYKGYSNLAIYILYTVQDEGGYIRLPALVNAFVYELGKDAINDVFFTRLESGIKEIMQTNTVQIAWEKITDSQLKLESADESELTNFFPIKNWLVNLGENWGWNEGKFGENRLCLVLTNEGKRLIATFSNGGENYGKHPFKVLSWSATHFEQLGMQPITDEVRKELKATFGTSLKPDDEFEFRVWTEYEYQEIVAKDRHVIFKK